MAVELAVARTAGISYLRVPAADTRATAEFYAAVFGWTVDADSTGSPPPAVPW